MSPWNPWASERNGMGREKLEIDRVDAIGRADQSKQAWCKKNLPFLRREFFKQRCVKEKEATKVGKEPERASSESGRPPSGRSILNRPSGDAGSKRDRGINAGDICSQSHY